MFDKLWDESPMVQKMKEESEARGKAEGKAEGELVGLQRTLVNIVKVRFPDLAGLSQQKVAQTSNTGVIDLLIEQIITAKDESIARWLLSPTAA